MKKPRKVNHIILFICFLLLYASAHAQDMFNQKIDTALRTLVSKQYLKAAHLYSEAFFINHDRVRINYRYDAARAWALGGQPDSAFYQLNRITKGGYYQQLQNIFSDPAFDSYKNDSRWIRFTELLKANGIKPELSVKKNYTLIAELTIIRYDDQVYRFQLDEIKQKYGLSSPQVNAEWQLISNNDSINQQKVKVILDKNGWPGVNETGEEGSNAIFLVIQHAGLAMQLNYMQLVKDAVKSGLVKAQDLAILEDRIATRQHKKQIYGSQLIQDSSTGKYYVQPLDDPDNVDKRRAEMGLQPFKEYLLTWQIDWSAEQYKKDLPMIERMVVMQQF